MSREQTLSDLFLMLFVSSDPLVSSFRSRKVKQRNRDLDSEVNELLIPLAEEVRDAMSDARAVDVASRNSDPESNDSALDEFSD